MRVCELMHNPAVVCGPSATLQEVARLMDIQDASVVVALDEGGCIVGVVTDRDLALKGLGAGRGPTTLIGEILRAGSTVDPDAGEEAAAALMRRRRLAELPVVDPAGRLCGIVGFEDLTFTDAPDL